jgi:hypothetical protein
VITYLGSVTIGECLPAGAAIYAGALAELQAKLAAVVALAARLQVTPPTLATNLALAVQMVAALQAAISLGMPGVDFQIAAVLAAIADINARLVVLAGFEVAMGSAGVHVHSYAGSVAAFGPELGAAVGGGFPGGTGSDHCNSLILSTTLPAVWAAMGEIFLT